LLNVPHLIQDEPSWCLPACIAMVAAYWEQPLYQADVAQWLGTRSIGTPSSRTLRLTQYGFDVIYQTGSLSQLGVWVGENVPCILFVQTGALSYWQLDTPHAVVLAGLTSETAHIFDPAVTEAKPATVSIEELMLAWSYSDYTYTVLQPKSNE
jgi:ABC-type bacteriocin/lantibiotic exporter with double-glycine peptidase domain